MLIPWGTDAPIYHWPFATVGLIAINTIAFVAAANLDVETQDALAMRWGDGLHPLEWFTSIFLHANIEHLVGNMIFLWAFGIVVEGKLGWWRFVLVYLGIGVLQSALEQVAMLGSSPHYSLGASAAIYGLLAICLVWAPRNDLNCISFFRFYPVQWEIPILLFASLYIGLEVLFAVGSAGRLSSAAAHSSGALIGFVFGVGLLKGGFVDCENWDLFTVLRGKHIKPIGGHRKGASFAPSPSERAIKKKKRAKVSTAQEDSLEDPASAAIRKLRLFLENKDVDGSIAAYEKGMRTVAGWRLPEPDYRDLIKLLIAEKQWRPAIAAMETYLKRIDSPHPSIRITLAQVLAYEVERPAHALRILAEIPQGSLPPPLDARYLKVVRKAEAMREEGILELEGDSW